MRKPQTPLFYCSNVQYSRPYGNLNPETLELTSQWMN
jgi:hypothetical protein